jgi:hypothetical protein
MCNRHWYKFNYAWTRAVTTTVFITSATHGLRILSLHSHSNFATAPRSSVADGFLYTSFRYAKYTYKTHQSVFQFPLQCGPLNLFASSFTSEMLSPEILNVINNYSLM